MSLVRVANKVCFLGFLNPNSSSAPYFVGISTDQLHNAFGRTSPKSMSKSNSYWWKLGTVIWNALQRWKFMFCQKSLLKVTLVVFPVVSLALPDACWFKTKLQKTLSTRACTFLTKLTMIGPCHTKKTLVFNEMFACFQLVLAATSWRTWKHKRPQSERLANMAHVPFQRVQKLLRALHVAEIVRSHALHLLNLRGEAYTPLMFKKEVFVCLFLYIVLQQ